MVRPSRQRESPIDTRGRVLDAAGRLLQQVPLRSLSIAAIARDSGLSRQTIYAYFDDADDVAASVFIGYAERTVSPARERVLRRRPLTLRGLESLFWADVDASLAFFGDGVEHDRSVRSEIAEFVLGSGRMRDYTQAIWLPVVLRFQEADVIDPARDASAVARWLGYQQTLLVAHPDSLGDRAAQRQDVRQFILEPLMATDPIPRHKGTL